MADRLRNMTLRQLRVFAAIVAQGSISRAADSLNLTQPAVSLQLKKLGDLVGLELHLDQ